MIASLAGEGIALALASGRAAGSAILKGRPAGAYQAHLARKLRIPLVSATTAAWLAQNSAGAQAMIGLTAWAPWGARVAASLMRMR